MLSSVRIHGRQWVRWYRSEGFAEVLNHRGLAYDSCGSSAPSNRHALTLDHSRIVDRGPVLAGGPLVGCITNLGKPTLHKANLYVGISPESESEDLRGACLYHRLQVFGSES